MNRACLCVAAVLLAGCVTSFDLQGHRGARGLAPENTLPAFERALDLGVATLELDTAVTSDGGVVVSHDPFLNPNLARAPDGQWLEARGPNIHDITFAELSRYDVGRLKPGTPYAKSFPAQVAVDGTRIPRLADLFALVERRGDRRVRFNIETKVSPLAPAETLAPEPFTRALIAEIRKAGMAGRAPTQPSAGRTFKIAQRGAPEITRVYLSARAKFADNICPGPAAGAADIAPAACEPSAWTAGFQLRDYGSVPKMVKAAGGPGWSALAGDIDAAKGEKAPRLRLKGIPSTVHAPQ